MKVSKDQHLKAEGNCLSAAAAEWSVTRDQTPGTIWGYHTSTFFLKIFANMYRERKTWSSRKFGESKFFFGEDGLFQMKEFRTTLIYLYSTDFVTLNDSKCSGHAVPRNIAWTWWDFLTDAPVTSFKLAISMERWGREALAALTPNEPQQTTINLPD